MYERRLSGSPVFGEGFLETPEVVPDFDVVARHTVGNIKDYGAVLDGTTDDRAAILAALAEYGNAFIPNGTAYISSNIALSTGQSITGLGHGLSAIKYTGSGTGVTIEDYCHLSDIKIFGTDVASSVGLGNAATAARWTANRVRITDFATGVSLANCWIGNFNDCIIQSNALGVFVDGTTAANAISFFGGEIQGNTYGVDLKGSAAKNVVFDDVTIEGNTNYGIKTTANTLRHVVITGCYFEDNGTYDIDIDATTYSPVIRDNLFITTPTSIRIDKGINGIVDGNYFLPSGGGTPKSIVITSATAADNLIGPNTYLAGAFTHADDSGTRTKILPDDFAPANSSFVTMSAESGLSGETLLSALFTSGTNAARPAAGTAGRQYLTTDNPRSLWLDTGSDWIALSPITVVRTSDSSAKTDNTLADDSVLTVALKASSRYRFAFFLEMSAANATMDSKFGLTVPSGASANWGGFGGGTASIAGYGSQAVGTTIAAIKTAASSLSVGSLAGNYGVVLTGKILTTNAGNLTLQWAQDTTDAGNLVVLAGSSLEVLRLA